MNTHFQKRKIVQVLVFAMLLGAFGMSQAQQAIPDNPLCPYYGEDLPVPTIPTFDEYFGVTEGYAGSFFPEPFTAVYGLKVYGVPLDTPITATYYIEYIGGWTEQADADLPVRFYALLNEQFIPLGEDDTLYRDAILPRQERFDLAIPVMPLEAGIYDLVVITIPNPNIPIDDVVGDMLSTLISGRITLIAGDIPETVVDERTYVEMTEGILPDVVRQEYSEESRYPSVLITLANEYVPWAFPETQLTLPSGVPYRFNIGLGQTRYFTDYSYSELTDPDRIPYALILFEDYEPVSITGDPDDLIFYGALMGDDVLVQHDVTLNAPESGTRDLVAVRIDHPGKPMCQIISGLYSGIYGMRVVVGAEE